MTKPCIALTIYVEMTDEELEKATPAEIKELFEEELRNYHPEIVLAEMERTRTPMEWGDEDDSEEWEAHVNAIAATEAQKETK